MAPEDIGRTATANRARRAPRRGLDVPATRRRTLSDLRPDPEFFGRFSERFARFMGTARFLAGMTVIIVAWVVWNTMLPAAWRFDHYPFIFLTLILSLQASYAAPLILLAQNRQEGRDRVQYDSDRDVQFRTRADMEFLAREMAALRSALGETATRDFLRSELRSILIERDEREDRADSRTNADSRANAERRTGAEHRSGAEHRAGADRG